MKNKLSKSILATSLATAGFVVGANHVQADGVDGTIPEKNDNKDTNAPLKNQTEATVDQTIKGNTQEISNAEQTKQEEITETLVQVAKERVEEAQKQVSEQISVTEATALELKDAESKVEVAREEVAKKEQDVKDATPENIENQKEEIAKNKEVVSARQEDLKTAREEEVKASTAVENQKNVVAGKQTLVDVAKADIVEAEKPSDSEKLAVEDAKKAVEKASADLANKQAEVSKAEQALVTRDQAIAQAESKVNSATQALAQINQAIAQKESELKEEQAKPNVASEYSYSNFLDYLQSQITDPSNAGWAAQARSEYAKHASVTNSNSGSYENALAAVRVLREVNKARKAAGLNELLINPFINYESQIQVEASRSRIAQGTNPHTGIYNYNENLAWGGNAEWAVGYWQNEKALYQQLAAQYGLPTDERQLDANDIYTKMPNDFYRVGHYVQNMGNKFNVATMAFVNSGNISQISFKTVNNLAQLINAGVVMSVDQYEAKLREFAAALQTGVSSNASKVQAELNALKAQRTGNESRLNIANSELAAQRQAKLTDSTSVQQAKQAVVQATANLDQARSILAQNEQLYQIAYQRVAAKVAPLQGILKSKEADLADAKVVLARLEIALKDAQDKAATDATKLQEAENVAKAAEKRLSDLENASANLSDAKTALANALLDYKTVAEKYQQDLLRLSGLRATYDKLLTLYENLQAKYDALHPENKVANQHPGVAAVEGLAYHGTPTEVRTPLSYPSQIVDDQSESETSEPQPISVSDSHKEVADEKKVDVASTSSKETSGAKVDNVNPSTSSSSESHQKDQEKVTNQKQSLPSTGVPLMAAGMLVGVAGLAAAIRKKKNK